MGKGPRQQGARQIWELDGRYVKKHGEEKRNRQEPVVYVGSALREEYSLSCLKGQGRGFQICILKRSLSMVIEAK